MFSPTPTCLFLTVQVPGTDLVFFFSLDSKNLGLLYSFENTTHIFRKLFLLKMASLVNLSFKKRKKVHDYLLIILVLYFLSFVKLLSDLTTFGSIIVIFSFKYIICLFNIF